MFHLLIPTAMTFSGQCLVRCSAQSVQNTLEGASVCGVGRQVCFRILREPSSNFPWFTQSIQAWSSKPAYLKLLPTKWSRYLFQRGRLPPWDCLSKNEISIMRPSFTRRLSEREHGEMAPAFPM